MHACVQLCYCNINYTKASCLVSSVKFLSVITIITMSVEDVQGGNEGS